MLEILSEYFEAVDSVLEENPILRLEKLLDGHRNATPGEIIQLSIKLRKQWNNYAKYGLEMCIVLTEEECVGEELVYKYDFTEDITKIIQSGNRCSKIYLVHKKA